MNKYHFFWKNKSPFSNWYKIDFTMLIDNALYKYNCMEQYMMHSKALLFHDYEVAAKIMVAKNPSDQKTFGRTVRNFDNYTWNSQKYLIVKLGIIEKFKQNPEILKELLNHKGEKFVEASPYDRVWGVGFDEFEALENIDQWGENLLGEILTDVCNELSE